MQRKHFLRHASLALASAAAPPSISLAGTTNVADEKLPPEKVREFVGAGHNYLDKVKALLAEFPNLIYASWEIKNGDFESALEGAGHVGNKEIAHYLIAQGARPNIFTLAMLGKTAVVKGLLEMYPQQLTAKGPHGFSLLHHAQRGGGEALELVSYLQAQGLTQTRYSL